MRRLISARAVIGVTVGILGLGVATACSLTSVTDIRVGECESDESCRTVLNEENGDYLECASYVCEERNGEYKQCFPIAEEICDGLDNDCDYLVDETRDSGDVVFEAGPQTELLPSLDNVERVSVVTGALSALYVQTAEGVTSSALTGGEPTSTKIVANESETNGNDLSLADGCRPGGIEGGVDVPGTCSLNQTTVSAGARQGYFVSVSQLGCTSGNLRVGAVDPGVSAEFIDRGPLFRDPTWQGVAVHAETKCTNNGSQACEDAVAAYAVSADGALVREHCGASAPSIAVIGELGAEDPTLPPLSEQALVSFLAYPAIKNACGKEAEVRALVLQSRTGPSGSPAYYVDPLNNGIPELLGVTTGGTPAGILPLGKEGFLIAYGDEDGNVRIKWLPHQENSGLSGNAARVTCTDGICPDRSGDYSTDPISGLTEFTVLPAKSTGANTGSVSLSFLPTDEKGTSGALAVTWVEGCQSDSAAAPAYAQVLHLDTSADGMPTITDTNPLVSLGNSRGAPLLIPSTEPFVVSGLSRNGVTSAEGSTGGFFLLLSPNAVEAVRLAVFDGQLVDPEERISVASDKSRPLAVGGGTTPSVLTHSTTDKSLSSSELSCLP